MTSGSFEPRPGYYPFKSWAEYKIARLLDHVGLAFEYEKPTAVLDDGKYKTWYPDFSLVCGPVVEYFGLMDNPDYAAGAQHKLEVYRQNRIQVLPVYPDEMTEGWEQRLLVWLDRAMEVRMYLFRRAVGFPGAGRPVRAFASQAMR